jgi:hypothetical protein
MSKTNQSKKYADPTTENKKIESGKAENNRTEKSRRTLWQRKTHAIPAERL